MSLMTPDEVAIYHIGGRIKLQLEGGKVIEDYLDDCRLMESYSYSYYLLRLRKHGQFQIDTKTMFDWSAE